MTLIRPTVSVLALALAAFLGTTALAAGPVPAVSTTTAAAHSMRIAAAAPDTSRSTKARAGTAKQAKAAPAKKKGRAHAIKRSFRGKASWYGGKRFHGRKTASGKVFKSNRKSAAHPSLPLGTQVRVTNLQNDLSTVLEINDRLPPKSKHVIDLSKAAAKELDFLDEGSVPVRVDVLSSNP